MTGLAEHFGCGNGSTSSVEVCSRIGWLTGLCIGETVLVVVLVVALVATVLERHRAKPF